MLCGLLQPASHYLLHGLLDVRFEVIEADVCEDGGGEVVRGEEADKCAGDEAAGAVGSLVFVGQLLHLFGGLVEHTDFSYLHLLWKQLGLCFNLWNGTVEF